LDTNGHSIRDFKLNKSKVNKNKNASFFGKRRKRASISKFQEKARSLSPPNLKNIRLKKKKNLPSIKIQTRKNKFHNHYLKGKNTKSWEETQI